jgi:hypothetical protein
VRTPVNAQVITAFLEAMSGVMANIDSEVNAR